MSTQYCEIFDRFLSKITDYDLVSLSDDAIEDTLAKLLRSAIANFKYCVKDLKDRDDELKIFNVTLDEDEQEILAKLMLIEWIRPRVLHQDKLENILGSRDYKIYSPANLLDKLLNLQKVLQADVQSDMTYYYYATK